MEFTPLAEPFIVQFDKDGIQYQGRVTYAKSKNSCVNIFNVEMIWPLGIESFSLKEKPVHHEEEDLMIWTDEEGRESDFYQLIGGQIAIELKNQLGILLLDTPLHGRTDEKENV